MVNRNRLRSLTLFLLSITIALSVYEAGRDLLRPENASQRSLQIVIIISGLVALSTAFVTLRRDARTDNTLSAEAQRFSEAELKARNALQFARNLIDSSMDMIIAVDGNRRIVEFNRTACKSFGYELAEILGKHVDVLYGKTDDSSHIHQALLKDGFYAGEITNIRKDGTTFTCFISASRLTDAEGRPAGFMGISRDISERQHMEEALQLAATTDRLTGIYNRYKFEDTLKAEMERGKRYRTPLSLLMFDLDHFKNVNDSHGHLVGDEVLKAVAEIVRGRIRKSDCLCRWGGEEFCILGPQTPGDQAVKAMLKVSRLVAEHRFAAGVRMTISAGLAVLRTDDTVESFIKRADDALYRAKANGRNRIEIETEA